uniref:SID1 transmembrane family member 2 n=1 Tax=Schistocephalus solidus TaxID=70667 RepID=A0A0X3PUV5_SCHSO
MALLVAFLLIVITAYCKNPTQYRDVHRGTLGRNESVRYTYKLPSNQTSSAVRVTVSGKNVTKDFPLLAVFKQQMDVMSFAVPLQLNNISSFNTVSRTLCPSYLSSPHMIRDERVDVELSSGIVDPNSYISYSLQLDLLQDFTLKLGLETSFNLTPSEPQYFLFTFPEDVDSVYVKTTSPDNLCMTVSVQRAKCPVADLIGNVKYSGIYQTVSTRGGITVTRSQFASQFFVVLVLKPNDVECNGPAKIIPINLAHALRSKVVNLSVSHTLAGHHYYLPVFGAVGLFLLFYIAAGIIILIYHTYDKSVRFRFASPRSSSRASPRHLRHSPTSPQMPSHYSHRSSINPDLEPSGIQEVQTVSGSVGGRPRPRRQPSALALQLPGTESYLRGGHQTGASTAETTIPRNNKNNIANESHCFPRQYLPRTVSHSLFSSSSSEGEEADEGPMQVVEDRRGERRTIHLTALKRPRSPQNNPPPTLPTHTVLYHPSFGNIVGGAHRRSVSYGSTRELKASRVLALTTEGRVPPSLTSTTAAAANTAAVDAGAAACHTNLAFTSDPQLAETVHAAEGGSPRSASPAVQGIDLLRDAETDRHVYLLNRVLFVSDLTRKRYSTLNRKYLLYFWYLIIISIFYGLPVAQLVMTYQRALHDTGNEDICYYNFECAHPFGVFTAFNNIISNVGYVMLGLLFLGLTARRDLLHRRAQKYSRVYSQDAYSVVSVCSWFGAKIRLTGPCGRRKTMTAVTVAAASATAESEFSHLHPTPSTGPSAAGPTAGSLRPSVRLKRSRVAWLRRLPRCLFWRTHCPCQRGGGGARLRTSSSTASFENPAQLSRQTHEGGVERGVLASAGHAVSTVADQPTRYNGDAQSFGIPQHFGLFYALGLALTVEGVLSACYHICPSFSNFQFDTAYMYMLALILMLKIYQTRHPDINASAHSAYMVMALVILVGVTGVLYGGETFWVLFTVVFLIMSFWLTAEIYYMGQWSFDLCLPRRIYMLIRSDGIHCLAPMYMERMLLLLVANCVNIGIASFGLFARPKDFSSFLLSIFLINLLMYYCFYIIMKLRHRERFLCVPLLYIIVSCLTWGFGIFFFMQHSTTWEVTPAQSRALNRPCILLGFYDVHDVWHFLSSISMFFSFMSIMTLDDDLVTTPRNTIPVF